jgi:hypothetical protein
MTITQPEHLIHAIPYLLGFRPKDSMVLIWVRKGFIVLTQRYDIDEPAPVSVLQSAADRVDATEVFICAIRSKEPDPALIDDVRELAGCFERVIDAIVVCGDRWTSALCDQSCCPVEGRAIDQATGDEIAVEFVASGMNVLDDRADLYGEIAPNAERSAEVRGLLEHSGSTDADPVTLMHSVMTYWNEISDRKTFEPTVHEVLDHMLAVRHQAVRDDLISFLAHATVDHLQSIGTFLSAVLRITPSGPEHTEIATVLAVVRWLSGDGARAWVALDRALTLQPEHTLAGLMSKALSVGVPPSQWRARLTQVTVDTAVHME